MKVCTDSCILGAWTALRLKGAARILDIGTGTGLLSIMLAQKSEARIDAIESDPESASQAEENIIKSPWADRIVLIKGDVLNYSFQSKYNFIIVNPPFFESGLRSPEIKKNIAKHDESLTLEKLISVFRPNIHAEGCFSILLPFHRTAYFENLASQNGFFLQEILTVKQTPKHSPFRSVCLFAGNKPVELISNDLMIKNTEGKNSVDFSELMKDYYG